MDGRDFTMTGFESLRILIFLLYVAVCAFSFWRLFPRLSTAGKRLSIVMLLAQLLMMALALRFRSVLGWDGWLWDLDEEWNVSTLLASMQLAAIVGAAMLSARSAHSRPLWQRSYLVALALVFLYLATEELVESRRNLIDWTVAYAAVGAVLAAATAVVATRSPRHERIWHLCLLAGLAIGFLGAAGIEQLRFPEICNELGFLVRGKCRIYALEEALEFVGIWLTLVAMLGLYSSVAPSPGLGSRLALYMWPILWLVMVTAYPLYLSFEVQLRAQPAWVRFESARQPTGIELNGYRLQQTVDAIELQLYIRAKSYASGHMGSSVHLVDQLSGKPIASIEEYWEDDVGPLLVPGFLEAYRQNIALDFPSGDVANRALWVAFGIWSKPSGVIVYKSILDSDHVLLNHKNVILGELVIPSHARTQFESAPAAAFENGFLLHKADLPEVAQAGETADIVFSWSTDTESNVDYMQYLHFFLADDSEWWGFDQQPLGPRLPTRLWYSGMADSETWALPLPADLAPGEYQVFTGLYRSSDMERLPASDANGTPFVDARVPLGTITIASA